MITTITLEHDNNAKRMPVFIQELNLILRFVSWIPIILFDNAQLHISTKLGLIVNTIE
jgi:hypothetical protein